MIRIKKITLHLSFLYALAANINNRYSSRGTTIIMKEQIMLQFPSMDSLWRFRFEVNANFFQMNPSKRTIICNCTKEHIELAIKKYNAKIVDQKTERV